MAADNNDPTEALADMMTEAQNLEKNLKQCVEIGSFMIDRNKELVDDNRRMGEKIEQLQADIESSQVSTEKRDMREHIRQKDLII